jgi:hypothetical protein
VGLVATLALLAGSASAAGPSWKPKGQATGTASTILVQKWTQAQKRVLIGTPGAGLYLFDGLHFDSMNTGLGGSLEVTGLASDPADLAGLTFFLSTRSGIFRTSDGGSTWTDFTVGSTMNGALPVYAQDTTDVAVTWDGVNGFLWVSTSAWGVWRKPIRPSTGDWSAFNYGMSGGILSVRALSALSRAPSTPILVAVTATNPVYDQGTPGRVYRWNGGATWSQVSVPAAPSDASFLSVSVAAPVTGSPTAYLTTNCAYGSNAVCSGYVFRSADISATTPIFLPICSGISKEAHSFFSVHHAYEGSLFRGAVASNKGLYLLDTPGDCSHGGMQFVNKFNGSAGTVRVALDSTPAPNDIPDELFVAAPGRGFFHGPPSDPDGTFPRYEAVDPGRDLHDVVKQVGYSTGFNGICEFASNGDSTVLAVSSTGGVFKAVDGNVVAGGPPCNVGGSLYFTRMNYFPNASDTANVTTAAFTASYRETGTVGSLAPLRSYQNSIFAGTNGSGVLRTDDGGVSWISRNGSDDGIPSNTCCFLPDNSEITALGVPPKKRTTVGGIDADSIVFAAVRNVPQKCLPLCTAQLVYFSIDGGANWKPLTALPAVSSVAPYVVNSIGLPWSFNPDPTVLTESTPQTRALYVATDRGLLKGTGLDLSNGTVTWTLLDVVPGVTPDPSISAVVLSPTLDETVSCSGAGSPFATCLVMAGTRGYGVWRSTGRGANFVSFNMNDGPGGYPDSPSGAIVEALAIAPQFGSSSAADILYASFTNATVSTNMTPEVWYVQNQLLSTYGGTGPTWVKRNLATAGATWVTSLAISPCFDTLSAPCLATGHPMGDQVLAGTAGKMVFETDHSDPSGSWTPTAGFYTVPGNVQSTAVVPDKPQVLASATRDAGIFLSTDEGISFRPWSRDLLHTDGTMVKTVMSLALSSERTQGSADEYRLVAGTEGKGLFHNLLKSSLPEPGWQKARLVTNPGPPASVADIDCGVFREIRFRDKFEAGIRTGQEFVASMEPDSPIYGNCAPGLSRKALRSSRVIPDVGSPDYANGDFPWVDPSTGDIFGGTWVADDDGLPNNGLQATSYPRLTGAGAKAEAAAPAPTSARRPVEPDIDPASLIIWGASGSGSSTYRTADRGREPAVAGCDDPSGTWYTAWLKDPGFGSTWQRKRGTRAGHLLPCGGVSWNAVQTISSSAALVGSKSGGSNSGVWLTVDGGASWWQGNEGLGTYAGNTEVSSFATDADGNIVLALARASDGGLTFFSESGGFAWAPLTDDSSNSSLGETISLSSFSDSSGTNTIYASTSGGGLLALDLESYNGPPTAYFTALESQRSCSSNVAADAICDGTLVHFCNRTAGKMAGVTWSWSFGDPGCTGLGCNSDGDDDPYHLFSGPGSYTVTLTATQSGGTDSYSQQVTIGSQTIAPIDGISKNGTNVVVTWTPPAGQTDGRVLASLSPYGTNATPEADCLGTCNGGSAEFAPTVNGSIVYYKLRLNRNETSCSGSW